LGFVVGSLVFILDIGLLSAETNLSAKNELLINHKNEVETKKAGSYSMSF
jgi:hypothetical protein